MIRQKISISILNADCLRLEEEADQVIEAVDEIHLDVLDGHFAPPISFGADVVRRLGVRFPSVILDTHLMVMNPASHWRAFREAGSSIITVHLEVEHRLYLLLDAIRRSGAQAGIAINPATDVGLLKPLLGIVDRILIMTVEPGYGGQPLIPQTLRKVEAARSLFGNRIDIEVDGGIDADTIVDAARAGANVFVLGSYIFGSSHRGDRLRQVRERLQTV